MRVSGRRMSGYVADVNEIADEAARAAKDAYLEMRRSEPLASVADIREGAKRIVESMASAYGSASGELAARMYDDLAKESGVDAPEAYVLDLDDEAIEAIDRSVRYHVGRLAGGRGDI